MSNIKIPIDSIKDDFDVTLSINDNSRIFFSGRFGIGKTYFLKDFFNSHNDKYDVYHLYPVNYQISTNDDILELIKYDVLVELLKKNPEIMEDKKVEGIKQNYLLFYSWCKKNLSINSTLQSILSFGDSMSDPILGTLGKLGRPLKELLIIDKKFQEFKKEYKKNEKGIVDNFSNEIKEKNISEIDYLSHILKQKIIKNKVNKKSVLVLDDLDRIDPEHIFRILNILSAYFEKESENKFGFDIIIIVADYSNIKNIFHHKYGEKTDFSGYLDKFFSISPYYYDNKKAVIDTVDEISKNIKCEEVQLKDAIGSSGYIKLFLNELYMKAVDCDIINLRELLKATRFQLSELKKGSYNQNPFDNNFQIIFDIAVKIAIHSFSNIDTFIDKVKIIKEYKVESNSSVPYGRYIITMLEAFDIILPEDLNKYTTWGGYKIAKDTKFSNVKVKNGSIEDLFYDLLIDYVKNKKYIKYNSSEYRY